MRDMTLSLMDDKGMLRDFADFKEQATAVHEKYNATWLKTEYDHAIGSATMASRWSEFKQNANDQPYLIYQTVGDKNVRLEHQLLDGIIRKITDDFWGTYFPPNGWKCRCDANQIASSYAVETDALPKVPINSMFATNLANTGLIYPKGHPYYNGIPDDVMRQAVASLPDEVAYNNVYTSEATGKTVDLHIYHGIKETAANVKTAKFLADKGYDVKLLPVLDNDDNAIRELIYKNKSFVKGKNPDALINNRLVDLKNCKNSSKSAIHNGIRNGKDQCNYGIINLPEPMNEIKIKNAVRGQMKQAKNFKETWVINKDELLKYSRKDLGLE